MVSVCNHFDFVVCNIVPSVIIIVYHPSVLFQLFIRGGYSVTLFDVMEEQLKGALVAVEEQLKTLERDGLLRDGQTSDQLLKQVSVCSDLKGAMEGAEYVQVQR